jgi:hypothetical protein
MHKGGLYIPFSIKKNKRIMNLAVHQTGNKKIAEIQASEIVIHSTEDALNLMGDLYYQGYDGLILYEEQITPLFFDLKTKMVGEILQKFSNYRFPLVLIGDFSKFPSQSLQDFIRESNKGRQVNFVPTFSEALQLLSKL